MTFNQNIKWFFNPKQNINCIECIENNQEDYKSLVREIQIILTSYLDEDDYYGGVILFNYDKHQLRFRLNPNVGNLSPESYTILSSTEIISELTDIQNICDKLHKFGFVVKEVVCLTRCDNYSCKFSHKARLINHDHFCIEDEIVRFAKYSIYINYLKNNSGIGTFDINNRYFYTYYDHLLNLNYKNYRVLKNKIKQILILG